MEWAGLLRAGGNLVPWGKGDIMWETLPWWVWVVVVGTVVSVLFRLIMAISGLIVMYQEQGIMGALLGAIFIIGHAAWTVLKYAVTLFLAVGVYWLFMERC